MGKTRIGIVGLGNIASKVYLPLLSNHEEVELVGLVSRKESTVRVACEQFRVQAGFTELEKLLELEPDAVFVHSPTDTHYELVMQCLSRGIHVYVDKPLSYQLEESKRMAKEAEARGVVLGVGFNRRFAPLYVEAKAWVDAGGGFDWCSVQKHRIKQQNQGAKQTYYDDLIHMLDLLLWLGGTDYRVTANELKADDVGKMLYASGSLRFGAATGVYSMARSAGTDLEKLELHGGGRSAEVVNLETGSLYAKDSLPQNLTFGSWDTILQRRGFAGAVDHFLASLSSPETCTIRADLVLDTHFLVEKLVP
ncbi:Gfo/Idh/MocA family protein [Paenibacillus solisilvae]|uniref:Gfo/Idh/MocA family protein n=1 Tax=Paenibacillus solisilvae TaxID=2486751 RepID=A0ABW0VZ15_9BACL